MIVNILKEAGYEEALLGLMLSFYDHAIPLLDWDIQSKSSIGLARTYQEEGFFWTNERFEKAVHRAELLAFKGGGHNKFLASMFVWVYVQAPRCWWSEYDTYKVATTANSSSTMHTLSKRKVTADDFEVGTTQLAIDNLNNCIDDYNNSNSPYYHDVTRLKMNLPESYLQERQICINYMTLQNIIRQRHNHRLVFWRYFCKEILLQADYPRLICENSDDYTKRA